MRYFHRAFAVLFSMLLIASLWLVSLSGAPTLHAQGDETTATAEPPAVQPTQPAQPAQPAQPTTSIDRVPIESLYTLPLSSDVTHTVQPREYLDLIAAAFDVQLACLLETNGLRAGDILAIGQQLTISMDCPAYDGTLEVSSPRLDSPGRDGSDGTYVVQVGDTLDTIGQALNISVQSLQQANDIERPASLRAGDVLVIPEDAVPYGQVPALEVEGDEAVELEDRTRRAGEGATEYVVQPGDTLDTIGQELDVSVIELLQVNNLRSGRDLKAGFTLLIPRDAAPYGQYPALDDEANAALRDRMSRGEVRGNTVVVQLGDTLDSIAQMNNVSVAALRTANDIDSALRLFPGRVLLIPEGAAVYGVTPSLDEPAGGRIADGDVYVLQPGDTLDHVAAGFNVDTLCLLERNEITAPQRVLAGQLVGIPADCPPYSGFDIVPDVRPLTLDEMTSGSRSETESEPTEEVSEPADETGDDPSGDDTSGDETSGDEEATATEEPSS